MKILRIVVPTDFSEPSLAALEVAVDWARTFKASIQLLHVVEATPAARPGLEFTLQDDRFGALVEADAMRELQHLTTGMSDVEMSSTVRHGHAATEIAAFAAETGADLIVIATHGRTGFRRLLLGSTTEEVVRLATCPVVSLHRQLKPLEPVTATCTL